MVAKRLAANDRAELVVAACRDVIGSPYDAGTKHCALADSDSVYPAGAGRGPMKGAAEGDWLTEDGTTAGRPRMELEEAERCWRALLPLCARREEDRVETAAVLANRP